MGKLSERLRDLARRTDGAPSGDDGLAPVGLGQFDRDLVEVVEELDIPRRDKNAIYRGVHRKPNG